MWKSSQTLIAKLTAVSCIAWLYVRVISSRAFASAGRSTEDNDEEASAETQHRRNICLTGRHPRVVTVARDRLAVLFGDSRAMKDDCCEQDHDSAADELRCATFSEWRGHDI